MKTKPYYTTSLGSLYLGDSLELLAEIKPETIDLICTSPPFALNRKKEYGNVSEGEYGEWFKSFCKHFHRVLKPSGSFCFEIGGTWIKGQPTRSLYVMKLMIELCTDLGFHLAQDLYWFNPSKLPSPAEWVTIRRERVKDSISHIWWLSKDPHPKANNRNVLVPYSESMKKLLQKGNEPKLRPSGHKISENFQRNNEGAIPSNLLTIPNTSSNDLYQRRCRELGVKPHPARFPTDIPEFLINLCTDPGDLILDPFAGSNTTGYVAEKLSRRWISLEKNREYAENSMLRFLQP